MPLSQRPALSTVVYPATLASRTRLCPKGFVELTGARTGSPFMVRIAHIKIFEALDPASGDGTIPRDTHAVIYGEAGDTYYVVETYKGVAERIDSSERR